MSKKTSTIIIICFAALVLFMYFFGFSGKDRYAKEQQQNTVERIEKDSQEEEKEQEEDKEKEKAYTVE